MSANSDLPQIHISNLPNANTDLPLHISNLSTTRRTRRNSTRNTSSDLPPPYSSIYAPTNATGVEDAVPTYDDATQLLDNYDLTDFKDKTTRIVFMQKVLALKLLQILFMTAIMAVFWVNSWYLTRFIDRGNNIIPLMVMPVLVSTFIFGLMVYCENARYKPPIRCMFLMAHPLSLTVFISIWAIYWNYLTPIFLACIYYCVVMFVLLLYSIFALQSKLQFVTSHGILLAIGTHMFMFVSTVSFVSINETKIVCASYASCIIMILVYFYILCDIQAMTSTNYWNKIIPADFVNGVINLHIDYYNIIYNVFAPKILYDSTTIQSRVEEILEV